MNKSILTKALSFVLVLCLLLPVVPNLGLNLGSVDADAAMSPSSTQIYFKAGSKNYYNGSKQSTSYEVLNDNGQFYIPVAMLTAAGVSSVTNNKETINGVECYKVVHGKAVGGSYKSYVSNMGLICITTATSNVFDGVTDAQQVELMKKFIFGSLKEGETTYKDNAGTTSWKGAVTDVITDDVVTAIKNKSHPYLMADATEFAELREVYTSGSDPVLQGYLKSLVAEADHIYSLHAPNGTFDETKGLLADQSSLDVIPYKSNGGYDEGGRQGESATLAARIAKLAYAYQITKDAKYSTLAYEMSACLCAWEHWGAGHFLNAADASYHMALAYDWCYEGWTDAQRKVVREGLFVKGVFAGVMSSLISTNNGSASASKTYRGSWTSSSENKTLTLTINTSSFPWPISSGSTAYYYNRTNNWNAVCTSGMILAALALIGEGDAAIGDLPLYTLSGKTFSKTTIDGKYTVSATHYIKRWSQDTEIRYVHLSDVLGVEEQYDEMCQWLINNNLATLEMFGLEQYIPDGSYIESATYWDYGTSSLFRTIAALESSCGTDYGLSAAWGLDKTAYFPYYVQSSDGQAWAYHDTSADAGVGTEVNGLYGAIIGDDTVTAYRKHLIAKGVTAPSFYDTFRYDASVTEFNKSRLELDHYLDGIEGYVMRESWERGSIYAAFMGETNYVGHGQVDSGAFVYYNNGTKWFMDIGTEDYNATGFGYGTQTIQKNETYSSGNTMYYTNTAEGNNCLVSMDTTNTPFGQKWGKGVGASGQIKSSGSNSNGGYSVLDQTSVYNASSASRGMLFTNGRRTVVIQDEITYKSSTASYWVGHLSDAITITLKDEGKTAYLTDGTTTIRCKIVDPNGAGYKFTVEDATVHHLANTAANDYSSSGQNSWAAYQKLVISCAATTNLRLAVVIDEILPGDDLEKDTYTWTAMSSWSESIITKDDTVYDDRLLLSQGFDIDGIGTLTKRNGNTKVLNTLIDGDVAMGMFGIGDGTASYMTLTAAKTRVQKASIGDGIIVTEFDITTASGLPTGVTVSLNNTDILPLYSFDLSLIEDYVKSKGWTHITLVIDEGTDKLYLYANDTCIVDGASYVSASYEGLSLSFTTKDGAVDGDVFVDDVTIRAFTDTYTGLDGILRGEKELSDWTDGGFVSNDDLFHTGPVAKLWNEKENAPEADDDSPIIDFFNDGNAYQASVSYAGEVEAISFEDLQNKINSGDYTDVLLYTYNEDPIQISSPIKVDTDGYDFYALSDNLICMIYGDVYSYEEGTLIATFVIDGSRYYVNYTGTTYASYDVASVSSLVGSFKKVDNGDGTYSFMTYYNDSLAVKPNGSVAKGKDLIVTSSNCEFYLVEEAYRGYYVTEKGGAITAGGTAKDFFKTACANNSSAYDAVYVTNDIYFDGTGTGNNEVRSDVVVYLNGHTVTYYSATVSGHMFSVGGRNATFYGPGTLENLAPQGVVMFLGHNKDAGGDRKVTFNDVTINTVYHVTDMRGGTFTLNNCTVNMTANRTAFTLANYNSSMSPSVNVENREGFMAHLVINGGVINGNNLSGSSVPVQLQNNVRATLKGGVVVNAKGATAAVVLMNTAGANLMQLNVGEYYINAKQLVSVYTASEGYNAITVGNSASSVVKCIDGYNLTASDVSVTVDGSNIVVTPTAYPFFDSNYVVARTGDAGVEYRVVKKTDAVTVQWTHDGVGSYYEYWVAGVTPVSLGNVKDYVDGLTPASGKKYSFDMSSILNTPTVGGKSYEFKLVEFAKIDVRMSMSLNADFNVNLYIPVSVANVTYNYFVLNGEKINLSDCEQKNVTVGGKNVPHYKVVFDSISPSMAADNICLMLNITESGTNKTIVINTSILHYAQRLMTSNHQTAETEKLMSSIVNYIGAANDYVGNYYKGAAAQAVVDSDPDSKVDNNVVAMIPEIKDVKTAIQSSFLDLGGSPSYSFRFATGFSGNVVFSYTGADGMEHEYTVKVENGIATTATYLIKNVDVKELTINSTVFTMNMKAYDMAKDITIKVGGSTGTYNLQMYYAQAVQDVDALYDLINALCIYCDAAAAAIK